MTDELQRAKKAIGVSTRCCYCCTLYLRLLNPDLIFGATSGKAYPWAFPDWENRNYIAHIILKDLIVKLRSRLVQLAPAAIQHRDSGSDSGRSPNEERKRPRYTLPLPLDYSISEGEESD